MLPQTCFRLVSIYFVVVYFVLATDAAAASGNFSEHIIHRNRRQTSGLFCPALSSPNTIVTCMLQRKNVACNSNVQPGTIAKAKCKRYYKPSFRPDNSRLTCLDNGKWDSPLFYCTPECGSSNLGFNRIVEGEEANVGTFPWQVGLYYRKNNKGTVTWELKCSGSLITEQFVLTVAHCVTDVIESDLRVALGKYYRDWDKREKSEEKRTVFKIIYQRDFSKKTFTFDVALLQLGEKVEFGEYIMPVCRGFPSGSTYLENKELYVVGWGLTREGDPTSASDTLQYNSVFVVNQDVCRKKAPSVYPTFDKFCTIKDNHLNVSTVQSGDSGGGITTVYDGLHFILGAVSAKSNGYSLFTNITWPYNVIWIESEMRKYDSSFRWDYNGISELQNNERGCFLPEASSSRKFCSLAPGCESCDIEDRVCFIPPGSKVDRVRVVCSPGYTLRSPYSGGDVAICMNGQSWYPGIPECVRYQFIPGDPWDRVTWHEARDKCAEKGYLLATIKSEDEGKRFKEEVAKQFNITGISPSSVWIGLSDENVERTFEWVDGSILSAKDFSLWLSGEPSNHDNLEHCVEGKAGCGHYDNGFDWNDNYCSEIQYYFCKAIIFSETSALQIPDFGKKNSKPSPRYKYIPGNPWSKVTWEVAKHNCAYKGSELAIIRSSDQQKLFEAAAKRQFEDTGTPPSRIWLGLSEAQNTNLHFRIFKWVDGSLQNHFRPCEHSNWLSGEPTESGDEEKCVASVADDSIVFWTNATKYQWNDVRCDKEYYYFCSIKLI